MEPVKFVLVDQDGIFVDGVRIPGVVHVDLLCGEEGAPPRAVLTIETECAEAWQYPENAHLFDRRFDTWSVTRDGAMVTGHIEAAENGHI